MPYYVNTATIGGYLVGSPDLKEIGDGKVVSNFLVALNRPGKSRPDYISCVAWQDRARSVHAYAKKGQEITVTGELETSTWEDRHGTKHTTTKLIVERFCLGSSPRTMEARVRKPAPYLPKPSVERQ